MQRRSFLLACAAATAALSLSGPKRVLRAFAAGKSGESDVERIIRLTKNSSRKFPLLSIREVESIIRRNKGRHIILSLQSRMEYETGHVPGALFFPRNDLGNPETLLALVEKLPKNKTVVLTCSNGHFSCAAMLLLRQLGIEASAMTFGMDGWNRAYAGTGAYRGDINGEICTIPAEINHNYVDIPSFSELDDKALIIQNSSPTLLKEFSPKNLVPDNKEYLQICLRRPEDYAAGHIPESINIPAEAFYNGDKIITRIPKDHKILLSCYVGHYSSGAALLLTQLGYETYCLDWGMAGWNNKHIGTVLQTLNTVSNLQVESGPGALYMES